MSSKRVRLRNGVSFKDHQGKNQLSKKKRQRTRDTKSASAISGEKADRGSCLTIQAVHCDVFCVRSTRSRLTMVLFLVQGVDARPSDLIK